MHEATPFFIILILLIVTFFMALIRPKGIRKLRALLIWFLVFFGDLLVIWIVGYYYSYKYANINIYDEPSINAYYLGESKIMKDNIYNFPVLYPTTTRLFNFPENVTDANFISLMNGYVDFIDYKEKSENNATNGKYFRIYLDNDGAKECYLSTKISVKTFLKNISNSLITPDELERFYNELHSNKKDEKQIIKDVEILIQDRNISVANIEIPKKVIKYITARMKNLKEIYKDKCIARKEISEDEIAPIEILTQDPHGRPMELKPNITTIFDNLLGIEFNYGGIIKDRNTGKILADNIYIMVRYKGIMVESLIKAVGSQSRISSTRCDGGKKYHLEECNTKLITEFFKKDKR
ncbi:hypothetical protein [Campylobacter sp. RM16190]|uniref:hypothetical protein n=1 Tax=Campylobacter sp. RM16190 TaxID=1705727 RepID=UPI001475EE0A|nr:hypothetical protein [Campylobacter sp. RM16190]